jgi:hypothetical protein
MTTVLFIIFCVVLTLFAVTIVADWRNRVYLWKIVTMAWVVGLLLVAFVNDVFPFAGGGDDENYLYLGALSVGSLNEAFDLTRFVGFMEQPGYPLLLSLANHLANSELLTFKALNLALYILLAVVWYRIGTLLQGSAFGRKAMLVLLLLTPLWFYFMFLLKDMAITLLQSLFLLGLVEQSSRNTFRAWLLISIPIFALLFFRTPLVLQSSAVLLATLLFASLSRGGKGVILTQFVGWIIVAGLLEIGSDQDLMASLGIYTQHRLLGSSEMMETVSDTSEASLINRALFPLLYLLSETSGLNPATWVMLDQFWLRGLLALPWIFIVPPMFILGVMWLTKSQRVNIHQRRGFLYSRMVATPWAALVMFVISYTALSWNIGDTTRWRIPDMPAIAVIALAGWHYTQPRIRWQVLKLWISCVGILFSLNILLKS